jgi:hypothetical protein
LSLWAQKDEIRNIFDLQGKWLFELDPEGIGVEQNFQTKAFSDFVILPGTTDTNRKGHPNTDKTQTTFLSREYNYVGKAWYRKEVNILKNYKNKDITLCLERTKPTHVWVDGTLVGTNDNISTMQIYNLTDFLTPGKHEITILVDNGESVPPQLLSNSHAYTESTQTNWNGIIGNIYLEAKNKMHIADVQVYPDVKKKSVKVRVKIAASEKLSKNSKLVLSARAWNSDEIHHVISREYELEKSKDSYEFDYALGNIALLWSEFHPHLYELTVSLKGIDRRLVSFGLRDFATNGSQFTINDRTTFLRGKHDACVFPLTAHTAMDLQTWRHYFRTAKSYGINHYRFHSWCPPKACFEAADMEGIYLQPELPFWGSLEKNDERLISFLSKEGVNIQNAYGNHASFVLFALGNELSGDLDVMKQLTQTFRETDDRHLYAYGSNNFLGFKGVVPGEDFLVTCRIGGEKPQSFDTHTRGSFSFADAYDGGYINHTYPNTVMDFSSAITPCSIPVISHESGQFQLYPNYKEMAKYTGVLKPVNFEIFRKRLEEAGMHDLANAFFLASGKWAVELYRADIEMDLRTPGLGGFQLLDLQDYPGQGSAFVGILDAFMDSKGLIEPEKWREFCSEVVPLFLVEKFCWTTNESLTGTLKIANYSEMPLNGKKVNWTLTNDAGQAIDKGSLEINDTITGLIEIGVVRPKVASVKKAQKLMLEFRIDGTTYKNTYPLWIYPPLAETNTSITTTDTLSQEIVDKLKNGESVLWFPRREQCEKITVGGLFQTDYWNYRMFKNISESSNRPVSPGTLGILTDPKHPVFNDFPTESHTNRQWFPIIKQSYPLILDRLPDNYKPIVRVIDNIERNHKLGLIFEFAVENGKLLVCMSDLQSVMDKPETKQLLYSMVNYMSSDQFKPTTSLDLPSLIDLFSSEAPATKIEPLKNISYE